MSGPQPRGDDAPVVVGVVGPTASGKSELGLRIAEELGGEIVGADAMQLYRGMDIGTAKLTRAERRGIPHHQLDVLDVVEEASVAAYQREARADIEAIRERGAHPVLVGGSGLYVRAALDRLEIPPTDPQVRARWEDPVRSTAELYAALAERDPAAAAAIDRNNRRRVVRALEVIELTGRPFSATMPELDYVRPTVVVGLAPPRPVLDRRIDRRVELMWAGGLLAEVRGLTALGLRHGRTAGRALGYAQALGQLDGLLTEAEAIESTATATRRYARRQESWFRADPRIHWVDPTRTGAVDEAVARLLAAVRDNGGHG